jgi:hypothetical protein
VAVPCGANINAYSTVATPGTVLSLGSCSYPSQNFTSTVPVTVEGQGSATTVGDINAHGAQNITFKDFNSTEMFLVPQNGSSGGRLTSNITFNGVNFTAGGIFVRACQNCSFLNGSGGNRHDAYSQTVGTYSGLAPSHNIVIDHWVFHDMDRSQNPSGHMECLFIQESDGVTVSNSSFDRCEIMDLYGHVIVGGTIGTVTLEHNHFGVTTPSGFYAFDAHEGHYVIRNNDFAQGLILQDSATASGCGSTVVPGVSLPSALLDPC